ncbi:MAG: hypothetical protein L3J20_13490 [Flavobacteriaceae bacterium]|nr:hypothetical protein [Flavobacteriaceae bacterium]
MITQYEQVCSTFLKASGMELELMKKKVKALINTKSSNKKPYKIDAKRVLKDYRKLNHGCVDEFLINYCWGFFMCNPSIDSPINREAYFLELQDFFRELVSKGVIVSDH